ncbi:MAG: hypothetical protein JST36_01400 [Bacteroidetes bacterium]|nr:hypothetical protein [Bacteroidota bacterium]
MNLRFHCRRFFFQFSSYLLFGLASSFVGMAQADSANIIVQDASVEVHYELTPGTQFVHVLQFSTDEYRCRIKPTSIKLSKDYDNLKHIDRVDLSLNQRRQRHVKLDYAPSSSGNAGGYSDKRSCCLNVPFGKIGATAKVKWCYTIQDPRVHNRIDFLDNYFIEKKTVSVSVPAWLQLDIQEHNLLSYEMELQKEVKDQEVIWTYSIRNAPSIKSIGDKGQGALPYLLLVVKNVQ